MTLVIPSLLVNALSPITVTSAGTVIVPAQLLVDDVSTRDDVIASSSISSIRKVPPSEQATSEVAAWAGPATKQAANNTTIVRKTR